jgi:hypothetical protein
MSEYFFVGGRIKKWAVPVPEPPISGMLGRGKGLGLPHLSAIGSGQLQLSGPLFLDISG